MNRDWGIEDDFDVIDYADRFWESLNETKRPTSEPVCTVLPDDGIRVLRARRTDRFRRSIRQTSEAVEETLQRDRPSTQISDHD